ncbi:hypothetical protein JEOAER750_01866 [Jeotgalicoccus aerolatus]|uniref:Flagellar biosynthesis GTPase FlhF n=1 Tax=Jeotgalicoccus aerolatus TaxID=709510 RepID=A0ABS4HJK0_9STAP|nr:hypothetical protein [Jeotgalicoccus aerolatus]MBP1951076.1 flagellar biosynthesis GTPase FlhF [Jeotgalicoccus aerolatus]GGE00434.1 hypothetical protein GCM10007273_11040 [Jeotgalicoccus aerolatus]CAD2078232.1 hypothetical protein JEOAER750_01866 [Jeotgalicoccus aerolatus]
MNKLISFWHSNKEKNWFIVLLLIIFFPVGIYLMWRYSDWGQKPKYIITSFFGVLVLLNMVITPTENEPVSKTDEVESNDEAAMDEVESKDQHTEAEKAAEEQREKEEAEKAAEEQREKEEAEKAAEEQREKEEAEKAAEEQREKEEAEKELTPEQEIEEAVRDNPRAVINDLIITTDGTEAIVSVTFEGRDNLTLNMVKSGIYENMSNILFSLKELDYEFIDITLMAQLPLIDQYGNEELSVVMRGNYDSTILENINPDNKYTVMDNIPNIALNWYEHPAMSK